MKDLQIFFDGGCVICSHEIATYRRSRGAEKIEFIDISDAGFDPQAHGLDPEQVHKVFHVKTADGRVLAGVPAFVEIWNTLPGWRALGWVARRGPVRWALELGYVGFVRLRPWLPRTKPLCESGTCARV